MIKYLKLFNTHAEYQDYLDGGEMILPNVSHCIDVNDVHYNPIPHDYSKDYLTFVALEDGDFTFTPKNNNVISYSVDEGETWTELAANANTPTVTRGKKILWKGEMTPSNYNGIGYFTSSGPFDLEGNVMSLLFGDNFKNQTDLTGYDYAFAYLFQNSIPRGDFDDFNPCYIVNAENFILPAMTLSDDCYDNMFRGCESLTTPPALPAITMSDTCYRSMFYKCTGLRTAPALPATTLASYCYYNMFGYCTSLTTAPELPATEIVAYCYISMFQYCTNLVNAPSVLPGTTLKFRCYNRMFQGCSKLTTAPEISATSMDEENFGLGQCCMEMFEGCTRLTTVQSVLYPTTLIQGCYQSMFSGCTSLVNAPTLPATTLASSCYYQMFEGCTSLTTAPVLPATTLVDSCYSSMFSGCTSLVTAPTILPATTLASGCYQRMFYNCTILTTAPELPAATLVSSCYQMMFDGCRSLNSITCLATNISASSCLYSWVDNVASSGTFVKAANMTSWPTGDNGIPSGWTVQDAS